MLSGLEMKHLFVSIPFFTILNLNEMRIIPSVDHKEFPCVQGNTVPLRFLINYCTLINIFSTQLWLYHTHRYIHTHITVGSIFTSEFLSLKQGVGLSQ